MNVKEIQIDFDLLKPKQQREIIRFLLDMDQEVDKTNYQKCNYLRYCKEYECFRFFNNPHYSLKTIDYDLFMITFKDEAQKKYFITEKEYKRLVKLQVEITEMLNNFKILRNE